MLKKIQHNVNSDTPKHSQTESTVSTIWAEVLQQDTINPDDNFFELGGDSLMTMMVLFRVNDDLHLELPPSAIMEAPTLREFCEMIDSHLNTLESGGGADENLDFLEETGTI